MVIAPLNTVMRRFEDNNSFLKDEIDGIYIKVASTSDPIETERIVRAILSYTHKDAGDFNTVVPAGLLEQRRQTQFIFEVVMLCIAGISLLVGGIGIMNIMLVSVTERTREIGTRLAIGALEREVLLQFLVEAVVISSFGGLIGIVLALVSSSLLAGVLQVPFVFNAPIVMIGFAFSAAVGVVFGYVPARKAARLDPIEALRHE
jgi:putative ABC transport system permease protein